MKKTLSLAFLALALAACTSTEYIDVEELDPVLLINAQLTNIEDSHAIHLSRGTRAKIEGVTGTVRVSVNGGTGALIANPEEEGNSTMYPFTDKLSAGDEVKITATSGSLSASATVTVPPEPVVTGVSIEEKVTHASNNNMYNYGYAYYVDENAPYPVDTWHLLKISLKDQANESNYYRMNVFVEVTQGASKEEAETTLWGIYTDKSSEPVFTSSTSTSGGILDDLFSDSNRYNTFTDDIFDGKEYSLKLYFQEGSISSARRAHGDYYYDEETGEFVENSLPEGYYFNSQIVVQLFSISYDQYIYLRALGLSDMSILFSEPVSIPSNVEGGMGFVAIDCCKEYRYQLSTL